MNACYRDTGYKHKASKVILKRCYLITDIETFYSDLRWGGGFTLIFL